MIANAHGTGGVGGSGNVTLPYVYSIADTAVTQSAVRTNFGNQRAMRAPGHPQSCALTEAAMDDLADKLGMDPIEFRLKNLNPTDFRTPSYQAELKMGAELIGWSQKRKPRGRTGTGPIKHGMGVALHQWGGGVGGQDKKVSCTINPDGSVETKCATQDLGTGIRTVLAIITAEYLGLKPTDIISSIGNSQYPPGQASGGSTTTPTMAPSAHDAVTKARDAFFKKIAPAVQAEPGEPYAQGRPALAIGRADHGLEGGMPEAGHVVDLGDRLFPAGACQRRRGGMPVCRGDRRHRDRRSEAEEDRRHPGFGPDHRQIDMGEPGLRRRDHGAQLRAL